ncbi:cobalamin biosynthesis protein CbiX [Marinobacter panjinensis]|uniref:Cobalamin biosynthesis protein CbiX n=1 Tax=Marinobacter panjinensis TaxID=2576384 RepID=A0A4U6R222_9GAMM|nr:CbiX/SirB N-terminal domain-containing protein [Marinobacter panjinensis]MCR8915581.1 CbiX/SirB N-terminal domain-containing protein [Marinobacter panjinensis]TKV66828.1 cobalamin biosynthesis protein CbiX [Marinobacter panjinensis]
MNNDPRIILLAHGSSDQRWCQTFEKLATPTLESVAGSRIAYMELAEPSLETIISEGKKDGIGAFTIIPLFLAAGRHLRKDVPGMIEELQVTHDVTITLAPPIGENPQLGHAIRDVVAQELEKQKQPA